MTHLKRLNMNNEKNIQITAPLVSIIIPTYNNREDYLNELVESIDNLTYPNFEVIIVDDASTDAEHIKRLKDLEKVTKAYPLQIIYAEVNTGPSGALNIGVSHAKGEYIKNTGHDDRFPENAFESSVAYMEAHQDTDVVFSDIQVFGLFNERWRGIHNYGVNVKKDLSDLTFKKLFTDEVILIGPCCLMHKRMFDKIGNFDPEVGVEDWDLFLRALDYGIKCHYLEEILYIRRKHEESLATKAVYVLLSRYTIVKKYQTRVDLRDEVDTHYIAMLEQLISLSPKDFLYILKALINDKEMGYSYLARLAVKNPMLVPKLMFRLVVKPDTKVFQKLKSVIGPLKRDKINV